MRAERTSAPDDDFRYWQQGEAFNRADRSLNQGDERINQESQRIGQGDRRLSQDDMSILSSLVDRFGPEVLDELGLGGGYF